MRRRSSLARLVILLFDTYLCSLIRPVGRIFCFVYTGTPGELSVPVTTISVVPGSTVVPVQSSVMVAAGTVMV